MRGIAIILVVVGHLSIYNELGLYIYSFHMPLFFFVSGYLFNMNKYYDAPIEFLKTKARALLIPYISFTIISYMFYILCDILLQIFQPTLLREDLLGKGLLFKLSEIFFTQYNIINTPLWFLVCLFTTETLFYVISRKFYKSQHNVLFCILLFSLIGYLCSISGPIRLPWGLTIAFTALLFYAVGFWFRKYYEKEFFNKKVYVVLILFLINLLIGFKNSRVDMLGLNYNNYILFYLAAFSGIFAYLYIARKIGSFKILEYYGKNSILVLGFHYLLASILKYSFIFTQNILHFSLDQNLIFLFKTVGVLVLIIPFITITNKHFSFMIGKQNLRFEEKMGQL